MAVLAYGPIIRGMIRGSRGRAVSHMTVDATGSGQCMPVLRPCGSGGMAVLAGRRVSRRVTHVGGWPLIQMAARASGAYLRMLEVPGVKIGNVTAYAIGAEPFCKMVRGRRKGRLMAIDA